MTEAAASPASAAPRIKPRTSRDDRIMAGFILVIALYLLMPIVKRELDSYLSRLKSGEIRKFH